MGLCKVSETLCNHIASGSRHENALSQLSNCRGISGQRAHCTVKSITTLTQRPCLAMGHPQQMTRSKRYTVVGQSLGYSGGLRRETEAWGLINSFANIPLELLCSPNWFYPTLLPSLSPVLGETSCMTICQLVHCVPTCVSISSQGGFCSWLLEDLS